MDATAEAPVAAELTGVVVHRGPTQVLAVEHLALPQGIVALVGPNGSGKSTLLHVLAGLLTPTVGRVRVLGHDRLAPRRHVAYVLQTHPATERLPVTVAEVVALGRAAHLGPWRRPGAPDRAAVADAVERMELGDLVGRHLGELSGGQRQRALVAQGLAQQADLLLLDEPLAGVDVASAERIRQAIDDEAAAGRTVVVATHDLAEAARSPFAVLLASVVVAAGPGEAVLRPEHLRKAYGSRLLRLGDGVVALDDGHHH